MASGQLEFALSPVVSLLAPVHHSPALLSPVPCLECRHLFTCDNSILSTVLKAVLSHQVLGLIYPFYLCSQSLPFNPSVFCNASPFRNWAYLSLYHL